MNFNIRHAYWGLSALALLTVVIAARRPQLVTDPRYMGMLIIAEIVAVCLWHYEEVYYPFLILTFLWAGTDFPLRSAAQTLRWVVLGTAAWVGFVIWISKKGHRFGIFHLVGFFCIIAALSSALVSQLPQTALLKAGSLALLFLYSSSGLRVAFEHNREKFIHALIRGCEALIYLSGASYLVLRVALYGNPNSLGGVMAFTIPIFLWGVLTAKVSGQYYRSMGALLLAAGLLYSSVARAAVLALVVTAVLLLVALRREKLLLQSCSILVLFLALAGVASPVRFESAAKAFMSDIIYKNHAERGLFASRTAPWTNTMSSIQKHPWLGSGYGTRSTTVGVSLQQDLTTTNIRFAEYANSYLAIADYMGFVGIACFGTLFLMVLWKLGRVWIWIRKTHNVNHYIVPIAAIVTTGLIHAGFEDWLTAPGSYFCIFFWPFVFLLMDFSPTADGALPERVVFPKPEYDPGFAFGRPAQHNAPPARGS